jgi:replicative DNA helicase
MSKAESADVLNYIEVCADIMDMYEVSAEASRKVALDGVECIIIDFADLMLHTAEEESTVALLYRSMAKLAKTAGVPVLLLSQLNRQYTERGGVPRIHNIRWSGLAEAMAALIILIYNPRQIYGAPPSSGKADLVVPENHAALIVGKSRFGFKQGGVGAIIVPWDGELAWGDEALTWQAMTST